VTSGGGPRPGLIALQRCPDNLEFPFSTLSGSITREEEFFVRAHFDVPLIDAGSFRLRVEGAVDRPFSIGLDELTRLQALTRVALLECAGNGRVFLSSPHPGLRWELGGVGNAAWTGVPLAALLERAGVQERAVDVVLEGADRGRLEDPEPETPGVIPYARSLPIEKARRPEVLLAHRMNGAPLTARHGFPLRAIVPGFYGMASVKWLTRIVVVDRPFIGYFQSSTYAYWKPHEGGSPSLVPVGENEVKAQIARPAVGEVVPAGVEYRAFGAAWAGESPVARVELSFDSGHHWDDAELIDEPAPYAWRRWVYRFHTPPKPGACVVMARATDVNERTQPMHRDELRKDTMINHVLPIPFEVR
jgi:DMSO/TMAO reductase YedYZ molybdopterin-dependent catalytic subunit